MKQIMFSILAAGGVFAQVAAVQNPVPGTTSSVNTINPSIQVQGAYAGSVADAERTGGVLSLGLRDAIARGIRSNLSGVQFQAALLQARGQSTITRSTLLPNVSGNLREVLAKTNLRALGIRVPGAPSVIGPFNYFDLRATVTQSLFDYSALTGYRASKEEIAANEFRLADARDAVVLAVTGIYLQTLTAEARIRAARAQVETARTLYDQAAAQNKEGVLALVDANRIQVQAQAQRQRLTTLENDLAKQKLNLARTIGLAAGQQFELADAMPFREEVDMTLDGALSGAYEKRADLLAAQAALSASQLRHTSARAGRLPSLSVSADYGVIGINPAQSNGTFNVAANLNIPIWAGGRVSGEVEQASGDLRQREAEVADVRGRIDADIRGAFLDIESAASQVQVARANLDLARTNLNLTRQRFDAGITDSVELSNAQDGLASAEQDVITSQFAHSLAKAVLARSVGQAEESMFRMLPVP